MTGLSLDIRTQSYASPQQPQNGSLQTQNGFIVRKSSRMSLSGSREKDRFLTFLCRYLSRKKVVMMILMSFALMAFLSGFFTSNRGLFLNLYLYDSMLNCGSIITLNFFNPLVRFHFHRR